jgi:hypothetical protein
VLTAASCSAGLSAAPPHVRSVSLPDVAQLAAGPGNAGAAVSLADMLATAMSAVEELRPTATPPARTPCELPRVAPEAQSKTSIALFTTSAPALAPGATAEGEAAVNMEGVEARTEDAKNSEGVAAAASEFAAATDVSEAAQTAAGDAADQSKVSESRSKIGEGMLMTEAMHTREMDTEPQVEREATTLRGSMQPQAPAAPAEQSSGASLADVLAGALQAVSSITPAEEMEVALAGGADTALSDCGDDQQSSPSNHCEPCTALPSSHQERSVVHKAPRDQPSTALQQPSPKPCKAVSSDDERAHTLPQAAGPAPVVSTAFAREHIAQQAGSANEASSSDAEEEQQEEEEQEEEEGDAGPSTDAMEVDQELAGYAPPSSDTPSSSRRRHRPRIASWIRKVLASGAYRLLKSKLANEGFRHARRRSNSRSNSRQQQS